MKKILSLIAPVAVAALGLTMASCSNDDVPVNQGVAITVDPTTVVSGFQEFSPGELTTLWTGFHVRVRLFIYDESGALVAKEEQKFDDYTHLMKTNLSIGRGKYTAVAMTDVMSDKYPDFAWILSGEKKLSTFKVEKSSYLSEQMGILGLSTYSLNIGENTSEIKLQVKPAGALAFVWWSNWNRYSDVDSFELLVNKNSESLTLSNSGAPEYSIKSESWFAWRIASMDWDENYNGGYTYVFLFPMQKASFQFAAVSTADQTYYLGDSANINIESGKEYYFEYNVTDDEATWEYFTDVMTNRPAPVEKYDLKNVLNQRKDFTLESLINSAK